MNTMIPNHLPVKKNTSGLLLGKIVVLLVVVGIASGFSVKSTYASTLSAAKDTITTSRPSASSYLSGDYAASDTTVSIANNGSRFLASDSARFVNGAGLVLGNPVTVASQSADLTKVYLANSSGTLAKTPSDILIMPVTSSHNIQFTTINGIPTGGKIVVAFPGLGSNSASPSATTFSFNGMTGSNPTDVKYNNATCSSVTAAAPTITCTLSAGVTAGTVVNVLIGCNGQSAGVCTTSAPRLVNPTDVNAIAGTADSWQLTLQTQDASNVVIDDAKIRIATIESVKVTGDVDPSITFTIAGIAAGTALSGQASGCADSTQNTPGSTPLDVSLGFLRNGSINIAAQKLTVSTNGAQGYTISATSSGQFINPTSGYWIYGLNGDTALTANDVVAPATFRASGLDGFGVSACGPRINTTLWGTASCTTAFSSGCKYSNPYNTGTNSFYATIATYTGGPVSNDNTVMKYAGTISGTTPPGSYRNIFTYVATATF